MKKNAQVWVETVVYTLIGLGVIATILTIATPQIEKIKDKGIIQQTESAMNDLSRTIAEVEESAAGNVRQVNLRLSKGALKIDGVNDSLNYALENTRLQFSEPGLNVKDGEINIRTDKFGARYKISLGLDYKDRINITNNKADEVKTLNPGGVEYKIYIENVGDNAIPDKPHLDFQVM